MCKNVNGDSTYNIQSTKSFSLKNKWINKQWYTMKQCSKIDKKQPVNVIQNIHNLRNIALQC